MKINSNISALVTNRQLLRNENSLADSMERLASGLKINHAADNPSGMAIAGKMRAQIRGLDRASQNASDGISVIQTADGALNEVTSMIQRMSELSVQAANGITGQEDKEAIQSEIESLKKEIDRISTSTEFNTKNLLDGSLSTRVYADHVTRQMASKEVSVGKYDLTITKAATPANIAFNNKAWDELANPPHASGTVEINGAVATIGENMTAQEIYEELRNAAEIGEANISEFGTSGEHVIVFESTAYGTNAELKITFSDDNLASFFGLSDKDNSAQGEDAQITLDRSSAFSNQATYSTDGNKVTITDSGGFEISFLVEAGYQKDDSATPKVDGIISLNVTDVGPMDLQIGANEGQYMTVQIPAIDTKHMYIDDLDVTTVNGAKRALNKLTNALNYINMARADLGAYQNRLESSVASLDETNENMESAMSRIEDADMAYEMTEYTKYNVLSQSATSALSQANELPQLALQLLQ